MRIKSKPFKKILANKRGSTAVEYGLICALVFLAFLGAVRAMGNNTNEMYNSIASTVGTAR